MYKDILDTQEFYELMQDYRWKKDIPQSEVIQSYDNVIEFIRNHFIAKPEEND